MVLLGSTGGAFGHSLEPGSKNVRSIDQYTQFSMTARNRFKHSAYFEVLAFSDDTMTTPAEKVRFTPKTFKLAPNGMRKVKFASKSTADHFYVCTRLIPKPFEGVSLATMACSRINLHHRES